MYYFISNVGVIGDLFAIDKALGNIAKRRVSMYVFSNLERRMQKIGAKEDLQLNILSPGCDATNGTTMFYALSGNCN